MPKEKYDTVLFVGIDPIRTKVMIDIGSSKRKYKCNYLYQKKFLMIDSDEKSNDNFIHELYTFLNSCGIAQSDVTHIMRQIGDAFKQAFK